MDGTARRDRPNVLLALMVLSLLVVVLDNSILNVALPRLADRSTGLGASQEQLEWSINSYTLVFASLLFGWSFLAERFGRRRILLAGLLVFGAGSLASAYARNPGELIAARAVMGLGAASIQPVSLSLVTAAFPPAARARAIGIWSAAAGGALALGPLLGGVLLDHFWWGSIFLINVPIVAVTVAAVLVFVPESRGAGRERLDAPGVALSVTGMLALTYGVIHGGQLGGWTSAEAWGPLVAGLALLAGFVLVELRSREPLLDVRLFLDRAFGSASVAIAVAFFGLMGAVFALLFYLQSVRGFSPLQAAACLMPVAVAQLLIAPRAAQIIRKFGHRGAATTGLLLAAVCFVLYAGLGAGTPVWALELVLFLHGVSLSLVVPPVTALMMSAVPPDRPGAGSATNTAVRQIGTALGVAVLGALLSVRYRHAVTPRLTDLPAAQRAPAGESIEKTYAAAAAAARRPGISPADAQTLLRNTAGAARHSFLEAMRTTSLTAAAATTAGALLFAALLHRRSPAGRREPATPATSQAAAVD